MERGDGGERGWDWGQVERVRERREMWGGMRMETRRDGEGEGWEGRWDR